MSEAVYHQRSTPDRMKISLIIPAFKSSATIARCLTSFTSQSLPPFEIIVVDSSPDDSVGEIVQRQFPQITYIHSTERLLPHAARTLGVEKSCGDVLVFSDSDIYAYSNWLENLIEVHTNLGGVIIGSFTTHTKRWLDWGIHITKLYSLLPSDKVRSIDFCATGNMLCSRKDFSLSGGFEVNELLGDMLIGWAFVSKHIPLHFAPQALVEHHHIQRFLPFLNECYQRGADFGRLRVKYFQWTKSRTVRHLLITLSGLRLISLMWMEGKSTWNARLFLIFLLTFPISLMGQLFWLLGESKAYIHVVRN